MDKNIIKQPVCGCIRAAVSRRRTSCVALSFVDGACIGGPVALNSLTT